MNARKQTAQGDLIRRLGAAALGFSLLALTLSACGEETTPTPAPVVVESGVTALASSASRTGGDDATAAESEAESEAGAESAPDAASPASETDALAATSDGLPILNVDDAVVARGLLRIYAAAEPNVPTLDEYAAGDRFTILGPPDGVPIYPVELAGVRWYRVRASDGLVGWVIADGIEPIADAQP